MDPGKIGATFGPLIRWVRWSHGVRSDPPRRIVVIRLDEIGDVVLTSPLIRELRRAFPNAWITLVVKPFTFNLVERCPHVDEVLAFPHSTLQASCGLGRFARVLSFAARALWRRRFDVALLPRWDVDLYQAAWLAFASMAVRRIGYTESVSEQKKTLNRGQDRLLTETLNAGGLQHEVERALALLGPLGVEAQNVALEVSTDHDDEVFAERLLGSSSAEHAVPIIAICAGAGSPERRWPLSRFVGLGSWLQRTFGARLVLIGGPQERELGRTMQREFAAGLIDTTGAASLRQAAAILRRCALYVGNNTGLMHIAAAAGAAVVEISCHPKGGAPNHPFSPARFGPWGVPHTIVQPSQPRLPCSVACLAGEPHCILEVGLEDVCAAVAKLLDATSHNPRLDGGPAPQR